jgi:cell division protein FtsQ
MSAGRPRTAVRPATPGTRSRSAAQRLADRNRSTRRRRWLRVGALVAALLVVAGAAWAVLASPLLAVTTVEVVGAHRATPALVELTADVPHGRPLARVDLGAVEKRVERLPMVASAVATRLWPHTIRIVVVERSPVATAQSAGTWLLLDADGVDIGDVPDRPPSLPVVALDPATANASLRQAACAVAGELSGRIRHQVRSLTAVSPDDVRLALADGAVVRWGSPDQGGLKLQVLRALMTRPAHVYDVSAPDAPTTAQH